LSAAAGCLVRVRARLRLRVRLRFGLRIRLSHRFRLRVRVSWVPALGPLVLELAAELRAHGAART